MCSSEPNYLWSPPLFPPSPSLTMTPIRHNNDSTTHISEMTRAVWYPNISPFAQSGPFHYKQDPVVLVIPHSPLLTYTCSKQPHYRGRLSSHKQGYRKQEVHNLNLPASIEHAVLSITIHHHTLPSHLHHTVGSLFHFCPRWAFKSQMSEARLQPDT